MPGARFLANSVDCRIAYLCEHPKSLIHELATVACLLPLVASVVLAEA